MFGLGIGELVVIMFIVLLLFGGSRLPQLGGALGKAMSNFKLGLRDNQNQNNVLPDPTSKNNGQNNGSHV
ncbi:MAG: hypothetical protein A2X86_11410 [Bdellovibrionales bacterium GWA2_49_15]|nr:MAG: hypothetical protein A2X86_11410 [Bdellovibrionales bacterium GWA2_49_15]HAZ12642.1 twin-arginine translocase TatA/TatE family subunit [Bdellovibrionales bacterium]